MKAPPGLRTQVSGAIGWLVFDRPEKLNAISHEMWEALPATIASLCDNEDLRCIILTGSGERAFVSGADIAAFDRAEARVEAASRYHHSAALALRALLECPVPTIARIKGVCFGAGVAIACNCTLRYAAADARFSIPAARLGIGYPAESLAQLVRLIGPAHAAEMTCTARRYDGLEAERMGLVNRAVPAGGLDEHVAEIADQIAVAAPLTVRAARLGIDALCNAGSVDLAACEEANTMCLNSEDHGEGLRAFAERRRPQFKAR